MKYFYTASSGVSDFPEFVGALVVDEIVAVYCDSNKKIIEPKQDWMKKLFDTDPKHLELYTGECVKIQPNYFKTTIYTLKQRFNQSGGTVRFHSYPSLEISVWWELCIVKKTDRSASVKDRQNPHARNWDRFCPLATLQYYLHDRNTTHFCSITLYKHFPKRYRSHAIKLKNISHPTRDLAVHGRHLNLKRWGDPHWCGYVYKTVWCAQNPRRTMQSSGNSQNSYHCNF